MTDELKNALLLNETDIDGALDRLSCDEDLYLLLLKAFADDPSMNNLEKALEVHNWDSAFNAVHALKGLSANLGLVPLAHALGELVIIIRTGRVGEVEDGLKSIRKYYDDVISIVKLFL